MDDLVGLLDWTAPERSSNPSDSFADPPHRTEKASKLRTLMARLLVLLNVLAMGGNTSFLTVLKSRVGRKTGRHFIEASTREWVGESKPRRIKGKISVPDVSLKIPTKPEERTIFEFHACTVFCY